MCHRPDGKRAVSFAAVHLSLRDRVPAEVELPVEASVRHVRSRHVLERIIADNVDNGAHHCSPEAVTDTKTSIWINAQTLTNQTAVQKTWWSSKTSVKVLNCIQTIKKNIYRSWRDLCSHLHELQCLCAYVKQHTEGE